MINEPMNLSDAYSEDLLEDLDLIEAEKVEEEVFTATEKDNFFDAEFSSEETKKETLTDALLKLKGIKDSLVTVIDENEKEEVINFYDLTQEEQLQILNEEESSSDTLNLEDSEKELIDYLRKNNLSIQEYLDSYKESILAAANTETDSTYSIDMYDDQELYLLDLKNKFDLSDEELEIELEKELKNPELFNKKIVKLREEYKQLEDDYKIAQKAELDAQQESQYKEFSDTMVDIASNITEFHGIGLEDNEKQETLSYLLTLNDQGISKFATDLNDPKKLYEAAWYLRYGKEAFQALENAYEAEIKRIKKTDGPKAVVRNSK